MDLSAKCQVFCKYCWNKGRSESFKATGKRTGVKIRRTLNHHPDWYIRPPKCDVCGHNEWYEDKHRKSGAENKHNIKVGRACNCDGIPWEGRHQRGSKWTNKHGTFYCNHYEDYKIEQSLKQDPEPVTDDDPGF